MANFQQICSIVIPNASGDSKQWHCRYILAGSAITPARIHTLLNGLYDQHGHSLIAKGNYLVNTSFLTNSFVCVSKSAESRLTRLTRHVDD